MAAARGKEFENRLEAMFAQYRRQHIAKIHKVDPPTRVIRKGGLRVIQLASPWLDYAGTWTAQNGRAIIIEAKSTNERRLRIQRTGGITEKQWDHLCAWREAGAATFIVWSCDARIRIVTLEMVAAALKQTGRVSIRWADAVPCLSGTGHATEDVLATAQHLTDQAHCVKNGP